MPLKIYGSADEQTAVSVVLVVGAFTVKFSVAIESQPAALVNVAV